MTRVDSRFRPLCSLALCSAASFAGLRAQDESKPAWRDSPKEFKALKYRSVGPSAGGRVSRVAGIPANDLKLISATDYTDLA